MNTNTPRHHKFTRLVRGLRQLIAPGPIDVELIATGVLERLWHVTSRYAIRGNIGHLDNAMIAELIGWNASADALVDLLTECGWLDKSEEHRLLVHEWHIHAPRHVKGNVTKGEGFLTTRVTAKGEAVEDEPEGDSGTNLEAEWGPRFDQLDKLQRYAIESAAREREPDLWRGVAAKTKTGQLCQRLAILGLMREEAGGGD